MLYLTRLTALRGGEKGLGFFFSCWRCQWIGGWVGLPDSFELGWDVCFSITVCFRQLVEVTRLGNLLRVSSRSSLPVPFLVLQGVWL